MKRFYSLAVIPVFGMDPLLALIVAMVAFAVMIFLISRSVRSVVVIGICLAAIFILRYLEVL